MVWHNNAGYKSNVARSPQGIVGSENHMQAAHSLQENAVNDYLMPVAQAPQAIAVSDNLMSAAQAPQGIDVIDCHMPAAQAPQGSSLNQYAAKQLAWNQEPCKCHELRDSATSFLNVPSVSVESTPVWVPCQHVGRVIGKNGWQVKTLELQFNTRIEQHHIFINNQELFTVSGDARGVSSTINKINIISCKKGE